MKKIICVYTNNELKIGDKTKRGIINGVPLWCDNQKEYLIPMKSYNLKRVKGFKRRYCRMWEETYVAVSCIGKVV